MKAAPPLMLATAVRPLYATLLLAAAWVLLRGHNEPGGGFIAGLLAVAATALWALVHGSAAAQQRLPLRRPARLAALGLLLAAASGVPGPLAGKPFLTHLWWTLRLGPLELPLSTVLLFDLGVLLCVWGALGGYALGLLAEGDDAMGGSDATAAAAAREPAP